MEFLQPETWAEALQMKAAHPQAVPIQGGTDVMVELNFDRYRPEYLLDLTRVSELAQWAPDDGRIRLGAGVSYTRVITELGDRLPGLAMASRTVGSPQIRNRGTVGGNLGAASPAGDSHPALLAAHAMVISVSAFGLALHPDQEAVGTGIGSAAPTPRRALAAEQFLAQSLTDEGLWESRGALPDATSRHFADLVAEAASPIDDVRGTARYRVHSLSVMARRALIWAWNDFRRM